jgi:RNA polymerase sigma-70 factor (ECF subfamily)
MTSDGELIGRYRAGDEAAFSEFYGRHRRPLFAFLLSLVRERETAEELFQETFFAFLRSLDRLDERESYRPLLARTARNLAFDWLRRRRAGARALERRASDPVFSRPPDGGIPGAAGDPGEVAEMLRELPREQAEAVFLRVFLELTFREIGEVQDCPEESAASRYRYGLNKLREALAPGGCDGRTG